MSPVGDLRHGVRKRISCATRRRALEVQQRAWQWTRIT